jgi:protein SCO1
MRLRNYLLLVLPLLLAAPQLAPAAPDLNSIAYNQKPGSQLPRQDKFRDDTGGTVRFGDLIDERPLVLALGYFRCRNLCSVVRADLLDALNRSGLVAGKDYSFVALSIDPSETSSDAAAAKAEDLQQHPAPGATHNWHFLTGPLESIQAVADAVGFRNRFDPEQKTFAHPAGIVFATPAGVVSSYLLGVGYQPADVRLAVMRAGSGDVAPPASPVSCFALTTT